MKAIVQKKYGPPETLQLENVEKPKPGKNEVLVEIRATAINDYDWSSVRGKPNIYRLLFGLLKPKYPTPGMELAGTVEALGPGVTTFKIGDEVYGDISEYGFGTFAEYISVNEKALVLKPSCMSFEEAAAIPHAAMLATQSLIDFGEIEVGQKILINGAGGGVGTLGLQIAKAFNAEVTGVDTGEKLEMMKSLGFDHVIDFKKQDFTRTGLSYDLILDTKTNRPVSHYLRSLSPNGKYLTVGGRLIRLLQIVFSKALVSSFTKKSIKVVSLKTNKDLGFINRLFEEGKIKPIIDGPYKMHEIPRLINYFGEGKHKGKVVISIE